VTTYAVVAFPPPVVAGPACPDCGGLGVTGGRYETATDGPTLLVDVFCPTCGGCGSAGHDDCTVPHAWDDDFEPDIDDVDEDACPSCQGREWNAVQGFDPGTDAEPLVLRVPCGCTEGRATTWTEAAP
jgi:hypothetical protein